MSWIGKKAADIVTSGQQLANGTITAIKFAAGAVVAHLGYTPVNKAGDTMTGILGIQIPSSSIQARLERTGTSPGYFDFGGDGGDAWIWPGGYYAAKGIKFDTAGRVLIPNQPAFSIKSSPATSATNTIKFANVLLNVGGGYSTSTGRFTAPVAGNYYISCHTLANTGLANAKITKNGTDWVIMESDESGYHNLSISSVVPMAAGDYVEVVVYTGSVYGSYDCFSGFLIG